MLGQLCSGGMPAGPKGEGCSAPLCTRDAGTPFPTAAWTQPPGPVSQQRLWVSSSG